MLAHIAITVIALQSGVVHRPDIDLPYKIEGRGAPVLMLSGGPGFTTDYLQSIIDKVGVDKYRWILLEQRGTPRSKLAKPTPKGLELSAYVADVEALRKQLGLRGWTVVGQSFGSMLAQEYAADHPERVTALALLDTPGPDLEWTAFGGDNINRALTDDDRKAEAEVAKNDAADPSAMAQ